MKTKLALGRRSELSNRKGDSVMIKFKQTGDFSKSIQYMGQLKDDHSGLAAVQAISAKTDTARHVGRAFLMLCFADSTKEEIVVPMVLHDGNWYLK